MKTRIMIVDDHQIIREGLRALLAGQRDLSVIAEAEDGRAAVERAVELGPDIIIMDIAMPGLNGIEAIRKLRSAACGSRVLVLSMYSDKRFLSEAFASGASGYLLKDSAFDELLHAIRSLQAGKIYISPAVSRTMVGEYVAATATASPVPVLSEREREILQLIAEGRTTKEIARVLTISIKTVETHRSNIMKKLDLNSIPELTKYAIREGIVPLD